MRKQFTDCFTVHKVADVAAAAGANGTADSANFDTSECLSPSVVVDVVSLAANKNLTLKIQHSDTTTSADFEDADGDYEAIDDVAVGSNGVQKLWYAGQKRYIRLRVTSVEAAPGATARVYFQAHNLVNKPENTGI